VIAKVAESDRRQRVEAHLERARQAANDGNHEQAVTRFEQALALGCSPERVNDELARARHLLNEAQNQVRQQQLREQLTRGDRNTALLDYLASPPGVRERVRTELPLEVLDWLEALGGSLSGAKARAAAEAVLALERANQALIKDGPERAEALLLPHARVLEGLPAARSLREDIHAALAGKRRAAAREAMEQAGQTLHAGRADTALDQLGSIPQEALSDPEKAQHAELLRKARRQVQMDGLRKRLASLSAPAELFEARAVLDQMLGLAGAGEQAALQAQRQTLEERIERRWRVPSDLSPDLDHLLPLANEQSSHGESRAWLFADDRQSPQSALPMAAALDGQSDGQ